jgi:hypothetical protein
VLCEVEMSMPFCWHGVLQWVLLLLLKKTQTQGP